MTTVSHVKATADKPTVRMRQQRHGISARSLQTWLLRHPFCEGIPHVLDSYSIFSC